MHKLRVGTTCLFLFLSLLFPYAIAAETSIGHASKFNDNVRENIIQNLDKEGYMGQFPNGQDLQRGMSAYLWDNRHWLKNINFHNARRIDTLVCMMVKRGYGNFTSYAADQSFMLWCGKMVGD